MKAKIICILVMTLLITTVLPAMGIMNNKKEMTMKPSSTSTIVWSDDFDSYAVGSPINGQGGWDTWDQVPKLTAYASDNFSHSSTNSMELNWSEDYQRWTDMVHLFYGVNSGVWTITLWQYIPGELEGLQGLAIFHTYVHGESHSQADTIIQLAAYPDSNAFMDWKTGTGLPLITDEWVEINVEIDFNQQTVTTHYNGTLLESRNWNGQKNLACINPCNDGFFSTISYVDDFSLEGEIGMDSDLECYGELDFGEVKSGETATGSFVVQNQGMTLLNWEITEYPGWADFSFDPISGSDLGPYDPVTINVEVIGPSEGTDYTGKIKIVNNDNPDDYEIIDVSLSRKSKAISNPILLFLHSHTNLFRLLQKLLVRFVI